MTIAANAPAGSLLGQLQRGRGLGFLRAQQAAATDVRPLLLACVINDPRWDQQLEPRSFYYIPLIIQTGTPLEPIAEHLRKSEDQNQDGYTELATEMLINLAYRGYANAGDLLYDYLSYGCRWDMALEALLEIDYDPDGLGEYDQILSRRFPDDDAPLRRWLAQKQADESPWKEWQAHNPRIARIFARLERAEARKCQADAAARARFDGQPLPRLVDRLGGEDGWWVLGALRERAAAADLDTWLAVVRCRSSLRGGLALRALQRRGAAIPPSLLPALRALLEEPRRQPRHVYVNAANAFALLPPELTLALAREWYDSAHQQLRWAADRVMNTHAQADDIPRLRAALLPAMEQATQVICSSYRLRSILDVLARYPDQRPYPEVEVAFREVGDSWLRWRAAKVLFASEPEWFSRGLAYECLWDCDDQVREVGCDAVHLDMPGTRERLHAIWHDGYIDDAVRQRAKARLTANPPG